MTNSAEYWMGALVMTLAIAHNRLRAGRADLALMSLDSCLEDFARSPLFTDELRRELASDWLPREETTNDRDALRELPISARHI